MKIEYVVVKANKHNRKFSEDASEVMCGSGHPFFVAIVDGHGFQEAHEQTIAFAQFVTFRLLKRFEHDFSIDSATTWFKHIQLEVAERFGTHRVGSAAACLALDSATGLITVAHAGDCRLFRLSSEVFEGSEQLTQDHTPEREDEKERLKAFCGPNSFHIRQHGECLPGLDLSELRLHHFEQLDWSKKSLRHTRGFGHPHFRPAFIEDPDVQSIELLKETPSLYAFCSDGGTKAVRYVFRVLNQRDPGALIDLQEIADITQRKLTEREIGPKHDATIYFLKVTP